MTEPLLHEAAPTDTVVVPELMVATPARSDMAVIFLVRVLKNRSFLRIVFLLLQRDRRRAAGLAHIAVQSAYHAFQLRYAFGLLIAEKSELAVGFLGALG